MNPLLSLSCLLCFSFPEFYRRHLFNTMVLFPGRSSPLLSTLRSLKVTSIKDAIISVLKLFVEDLNHSINNAGEFRE